MKIRVQSSTLTTSLLIAGLACIATARAAVDNAPAATTPASNSAAPGKIRPVVGALLTGSVGQDTAAAINPDGSSVTFDPGARYELFGGAEFPLAGNGLTLRLTLGVHTAQASNSSGGTERFTRFPLEATLLYPMNDSLRVGAGVRYPARLRFSGAGDDTADGISATPGVLVMADWFLAPHVALEGRYVVERYLLPGGGSITADHFGVGVAALY